MPNEITAIELAREMFTMLGDNPHMIAWDSLCEAAELHLLATRAYAALQAEQAKEDGHDFRFKKFVTDDLSAKLKARGAPEQRKFDPGVPVLDEAGKLRGFTAQPTEAPGRVRCWMGTFFDGTSEVTIRESLADAWRANGHPITPGHFTPDTEAHE